MPVKVAVIVCNASLIPFFVVKDSKWCSSFLVYTKEDGLYLRYIKEKKCAGGYSKVVFGSNDTACSDCERVL